MFLDLFSPFGHAASGPIPPSPWLLLLALGLDGYFGEMPLLFRALPHPVVLMGRAIGALDRRWNKVKDKDWVRRLKGVAALVVLVTVAGVIGLLVHGLTRLTSFGFLLEILIAGILVAQKSLYDHVMAVARSLDQAGLAGGRAAVAHIVGRDPNQLDQAGVSRAAIESAAENLSDGVVAPVFWYLIAGMPGLMIYKMVNTADSMIGHRTPRHKAFGWGAARVDDLLNLVPARLTAGLLILAAIEPKWASPSRAWATWRR
ncbi:MAG: cobalamin biosynthesis protein CobD/CbiB, partial [Rhodospirillaceae bacterium]